MGWENLRTDYTDATWTGLKRYNEITNDDGTVSFQDITTYSNREKSFFGATDANRMNATLNNIMNTLAYLVEPDGVYKLLTNFTSDLNPDYTFDTKKFQNYWGGSDVEGDIPTAVTIESSMYNPDKGDSLLLWVDYCLYKMNTDYYLTTAGDSLYIVNFITKPANGADIIVQVWHKPQNSSNGTVVGEVLSISDGSIAAGISGTAEQVTDEEET